MLKPRRQSPLGSQQRPAAFGRLCVETTRYPLPDTEQESQPPSGGCVLKPARRFKNPVLVRQPPSGGYVLKLDSRGNVGFPCLPAAFRRLCVETRQTEPKQSKTFQPPSGGCVLKLQQLRTLCRPIPSAAFGRLCVQISSKQATLLLILRFPRL